MRRSIIPWVWLWFGCMVLTVLGTAEASQSTYKKAPHLAVALVSEAASVAPGATFWVAIHQKIEKDWHTYWKNPGDSGLQPSLKWKLPKGVKASKLRWPVPHKIRVKHLANYGYEHEVYLQSRITLPADWKQNTLKLEAAFSWLVCKVECIPGKATLSLTLPVKPPQIRADAVWQPRLTRAREDFPVQRPAIKTQVVAEPSGLRMILTGLRPQDTTRSQFVFYPSTDSIVDNAAAQKVQQRNGTLSFQLKKSSYYGSGGDILKGLVVSVGANKRRVGWQVSAPIETSAAGAQKATSKPAALAGTRQPPPARRDAAQAGKQVGPTDSAKGAGAGATIPLSRVFAGWKPWGNQKESMTLWQALLFALLGGLILNLMPCVFPVLSIKILHFVEQSRAEASSVRRHGVAFWLGVQLSFSLLAGALIGLRASGDMIGWGFQLQLPHVIFVLAVVLFVMGLSLSGLFEVGSSLMNVGDSLASRSGYTGSFFTGILATVVATPCTAPLMGAAIAFALTQPVWASLLIFNMLGLGMSLPYLLLSFFPATLRWMPRPGAWMERVKQIMAFPMYGAAIWLLWVLGKQTGRDGIVTALIALLTVAFACWLYGTTRLSQRLRTWATVGALTIAGASLFYGIQQIRQDARIFAAAQQRVKEGLGLLALQRSQHSGQFVVGQKEDYQRSHLARLLRERKNVFLNLTAAWCISCKVNEKVALTSESVKKALVQHQVHYLVGDWTHRDADIAGLLEHFGRNGVPLYVVFYGQSKRYKILPQVLTPGIVTDALGATAPTKGTL